MKSDVYASGSLLKRRRRIQIPAVYESSKISESQTEFNEEDELVPEDIVKDIKNPISQERITDKPQLESVSVSRVKIEDYVEEQDGQSETSIESPNESLEEDEYIEDEDTSATPLEYYLVSVDSSLEKDSLLSFDLMLNFPGISYCHIMAEDGTLNFGITIIGSILISQQVQHNSRGNIVEGHRVTLEVPSPQISKQTGHKRIPSHVQCETLNPRNRNGGCLWIP